MPPPLNLEEELKKKQKNEKLSLLDKREYPQGGGRWKRQ